MEGTAVLGRLTWQPADVTGVAAETPRAKTLAFDPKTKNIYLSAAEFVETPASEPGQRPRRSVKPA